MSILRDFERRLEGAVEGFFARAFRSGLQPVELAKAVQRYAGNYQQVGVDGVIVPNVYRFALSGDDLERFEGYDESLRRELAQVVSRTVADRGWQLQGPVRVELTESEAVRTGTYELRGKIEAGPLPTPSPPTPAPSSTPVSRVPGGSTQLLHTSAPPATLVDRQGRRFPLEGTVVLGRLPECDVTLDDPAVSRRHARIVADDGTYRIEDLGSTNGVRINGETISRAALRDGDQLDLGGVRVTFTFGR